jgi:hypothetical protein
MDTESTVPISYDIVRIAVGRMRNTGKLIISGRTPTRPHRYGLQEIQAKTPPCITRMWHVVVGSTPSKTTVMACHGRMKNTVLRS